MLHSDWGRWLIDEIESAAPTGLTGWYLGCNGFILKSAGDTTVYIDPYLGLGDPPRTVRMIPVPFGPADPSEADAVVVTHEHTDHLHGETQGPLVATTGASLVASPGCIDRVRDRGWTETYGFDDTQLLGLEVGSTVSIGDIDITAHPGTDPDATADTTFVFESEGDTFVHPGDGRPDDGLSIIGEEYDVDATVAAVGSSGMIPDKQSGEPTHTQWYNDHNDCVQVASQLHANVLIPTHWDMWKGMTTDPTTVHQHARSFTYPRRVEILEIGDRFDLSH